MGRRIACAGGVGLTAVVLAALGTVGWLQTAAGRAFLKGRIERAVTGALAEGDLVIGDMRTNLFSHVGLRGVALRQADGTPVIGVASADARIRLLDSILHRRVIVSELRIDDVDVDLHTQDGSLNLARLFPAADPAAPTSDTWLPVDLEVRAVALSNVDLRYDGYRLEGVDLTGAVTGIEDRLTADDLSLTGGWVAPVTGPLTISGVVAYDGDRVELSGLQVDTLDARLGVDGHIGLVDTTTVALDVDLGRLDLSRIDPILGHAGFEGVWTGGARVRGPLSDLTIHGALDGVGQTHGGLDVDVVLDLAAETLAWRADATLRSLRLDHLLAPVARTVQLTGHADVSGSGTRWPDGMRIQGHFEGDRQEAYGYVLHALATDFRIDEGVVTLEELAARHDAAFLTGGGTIDVVEGPMDLSLAGDLYPAGLATLGAPGMSGRGTVALRLRGDIFAPTTAYRLSGQAHLRDVAYADSVAVDALTARLSGLVTDEEVTVLTALDAEGVAASGARIDRVFDEAVTVLYQFSGDTTIAGENTHAEGIAYPSVVGVTAAAGSWAVHVPASGSWEVDASMVVGSYDLLGYPGTDGVVDLWIDPTSVDFDVYLADGARPTLRTIGTYGIDDATVNLAGLSVAPVPGASWDARRPVVLRLVDGGIADATVELGSRHGEIVVRGDLGTAGALDGTVSVTDLDLSYVTRLVPGTSPLEGTLALDVTLGGAATDARVVGTSSGTVAVGDRPPVSWDARVDARDGIADLDLRAGLADARLGRVAGTLPVRLDLADPWVDPDGPIDLRVSIAPGPLARFGRLAERDVPEGRLSATAHAHGILRDPDLDLAAVFEAPVQGLADRARVELGVTKRADDLAWWVDVLEGYGLAATFEGTALTRIGRAVAWAIGAEATGPDWTDGETYAREMDARLTLDDLHMDSLATLGGYPGLATGSLVGGFAVTGSPVRPRVAGGVTWADASVADMEILGASLAVSEGAEGYRLDSTVEFADGGIIDISGPIPVEVDLSRDLAEWSTRALDLSIEGRHLPFAAFAPFLPGAGRGSGTLEIVGQVHGTIDDPAPRVRMTLSNAGMVYDPLGIRISRMGMQADLSHERLSIRDLSLRTQPRRRGLGLTDEAFAERVTGAMEVAFVDWTPTQVSGRIDLDGAWVMGDPDTQLRGTGSIDIGGTYPALEITGDVAVDNALIVQDLASFLEVAPLALDDRITVRRSHVSPVEREPPEPEEPGVWESMTVEVNVDLARNVEVQVAFPFLDDLGALGASITRADVAARIGGQLTYALDGGTPSLRGPVDVIEGTVRVLQTTFHLNRGTATFQGDMFDPIIDLSATSTVGDASVDLTVTGTAYQPRIAFTSEQYPDQTQILTLLITGRAPDELSSDQGSAAAQALLGLVVSSVLSGARLGSLSYDPDGTLRIGLPVARNVYLETAFATQANLDENQFVGDLEWQIASQLVLDVAIGNKFSWVDLFWETRF